MANTIGTLAISVRANTDKAVKSLRNTMRSVDSLSKSVARASRAFATVSTAGLAAGTAIGTAMVKNSFNTIDSLAKMSARLNVATEDLIGLRLAAGLSGASVSELEGGLQRMVRGVSEASVGIGTAQKALKELNVDAVALNQLTPGEQFRKLADSLGMVSNRADQVRLSYDLFGRSGVGLINTLKGGSAALLETAREAEALGLTFSNIDAAGIEMANDSVSKLQLAVKGVSDQIAIGFAPVVDGIAKSMTTAFKDLSRDIDLSGEAFKGLVNVMGLGADILRYLEIGWKSLEVVGSAAVAGLFDVVTELSIGLETMLDELGLVERGWTDAMKNMRTGLYDTLETNTKELETLWNAPLPGQQVEEQIKKWGQASRDAAAEAAKLKQTLEEVSRTGPFLNSITTGGESVDDLMSKLDKQLMGESPLLVQLANAGASVEEMADAMAKLAKIDLKTQSDDLDAIAQSLRDSLKSPSDVLGDFIVDLDSLGDRLSEIEKSKLVSKRFDELFGGGLDNASVPQSPAALQAGTVEARSAEIRALNQFNNNGANRENAKRDKLLERIARSTSDSARYLDYIERREGIQVVDN